MNRKKIILLIIYMLFITLFLCGCGNNEEGKMLESKVNSEINYLDKHIIGVMNKLSNITLENYEVKSKNVDSKEQQSGQSKSGENSSNTNSGEGKSEGESSGGSTESQETNSLKVMQMQPSNILVIDKNNIDWTTIKSEIEVMYTSWNSILIDLYTINSKNEDILNFSQTLDNTILVAKTENKADTLAMLANLYAYLPRYSEFLSIEESEKNILKTKSYVLNAYALVEQDNWAEVQNQINLADEVYSKVTNDIKYVKNKQEEVTRVYVLLKELKNSIVLQDKDIFFIKYKNLMNSI